MEDSVPLVEDRAKDKIECEFNRYATQPCWSNLAEGVQQETEIIYTFFGKAKMCIQEFCCLKSNYTELKNCVTSTFQFEKDYVQECITKVCSNK